MTWKKASVITVLGICTISLAVFAAWIANRQRQPGQDQNQPEAMPVQEVSKDLNKSEAMRVVSLQDIARLPPEPTYDDVAKLLKEHDLNYTLFADNLMYRCPAKEGGVYFFCFWPTQEVSLPEQKLKSDRLFLVAVIKFPSEDAFWQWQGGTYVYPAKIAGVKFSGILPFDDESWNRSWWRE